MPRAAAQPDRKGLSWPAKLRAWLGSLGLWRPRSRWRSLAQGPRLLVAAAGGALACAGSPGALRLEVASGPRSLSPEHWRQAVLEQVSRAGEDDSPGSSRARARSREAPALAVGASSGELIAARLDREPQLARSWHADVDVLGLPALAPGLVLFGTPSEIVALHPEDGRRLWAVPARRRLLLSATSNGEDLALLLMDRVGRRSISVYDTERRERLRVFADGLLGTPALLDGTLLVPWGAGFLSAIDPARSTEQARTRLATEPVHALRFDGALFFGGPPWLGIEPSAGAPVATDALPRRPLPGLVESGSAPVSPPLAAGSIRGSTAAGAAPAASVTSVSNDVTRLYVRPRPRTAGSSNAPQGDERSYMATYGRIAFGLEREHGALQWVVALPGRALAALPVPSGFLVCDESGGVRLLAAGTGRVTRSWQLVRQRRLMRGEPALAACALAGGELLAPEPDPAGQAEQPLLAQLARVLEVSDPTLTDAQRFLARELAARPEPEATRVLIDLVTRHSLDRVLQSEAEDLLATRRSGREHMLAALQATGSREESVPPIAPLAEALAALDEREAAPLIARQLNRVAHPASALARAAAALEELASPDELDELSVFFSLHRTTADGPEWVAAVVSVGRTLLRVGGEPARTLIRHALRDPLTIPDVRNALERELGSDEGARERGAGNREWGGVEPRGRLTGRPSRVALPAR